MVCCGACCLFGLVGFIYHKKQSKSAASSHRSLQPPPSQSRTVNNYSHPYTAQEFSSVSQSYQSSAYDASRLQPTSIVTTEPSAPPLPLEAAVTHAGEAPPAYHTVVQYKTVDPRTSEDARLSKDVALSEHPTNTTETAAPPVYYMES